MGKTNRMPKTDRSVVPANVPGPRKVVHHAAVDVLPRNSDNVSAIADQIDLERMPHIGTALAAQLERISVIPASLPGVDEITHRLHPRVRGRVV